MDRRPLLIFFLTALARALRDVCARACVCVSVDVERAGAIPGKIEGKLWGQSIALSSSVRWRGSGPSGARYTRHFARESQSWKTMAKAYCYPTFVRPVIVV